MGKYISIRELVEMIGTVGPINSIAEYVSLVTSTSDKWQEQDWKDEEQDEDTLLNDARIVGQAWFRGHADCSMSLRPGLYRNGTWGNLGKLASSPRPPALRGTDAFNELFDLEHELRIDFTSYGHLLNQANHARTSIDWYFMMQHHGVPTRLLDWTTNALAALFFALDGLRQRIEDSIRLCKECASLSAERPQVAVWMIDAYWLANKLSETWSTPMLPWSEDAARYIPPLDALIDKNADSIALIPTLPMPIEPPALHPRVAAQEGRFIIFGKSRDLLEEKRWIEDENEAKPDEFRIRQIQFRVNDVDALLRDLAQLGVSRRTLFPDLSGLADFVRWKHLHRVRPYPAP